MFGAAALGANMNKGNNNLSGSPATAFSTGLLGSGAVSQALSGSQRVSDPEATGQVVPTGGITPQVPMSPSYNEAAALPVFPPSAQAKAAAVFGTNDQRQGATGGFNQESKDRIISELNNL
jgi:hypothetical protein